MITLFLFGRERHAHVGVIQRKLEDWDPPEVFDTLTLARRLLPGRTSYNLDALVTTSTWCRT